MKKFVRFFSLVALLFYTNSMYAQDITSGLVMNLKFDETTGTSLTDATSYHNNATLWSENSLAAPSFVAGKVNNALSLVAANHPCVEVVNNNSLNITSSITISIWVNATSWGTGNRDLIKKRRFNAHYLLGSEKNDANGSIYPTFMLNDNAFVLRTPNNSDVVCPINTWHMLTGTYNGSVMTLYVDGVFVSSMPASGPISSSNDNLQIGGSIYENYYDGKLDDARIYNRCLSATDVQALFTQSGGGGTTGGGTGSDSFWKPNGSDIYYQGGFVGVGQPTPKYNLDVVGDINYTGRLLVDGYEVVIPYNPKTSGRVDLATSGSYSSAPLAPNLTAHTIQLGETYRLGTIKVAWENYYINGSSTRVRTNPNYKIETSHDNGVTWSLYATMPTKTIYPPMWTEGEICQGACITDYDVLNLNGIRAQSIRVTLLTSDVSLLNFCKGIQAYEYLPTLTTNKMGIGTSSPDYELDVVGTIRAHKVIVNLKKGADFVFADDYSLMDLKALQYYITENNHLPNIPSAGEMEKTDLDVSEFQVLLLRKIEELTLYILEQNKQIEKQKSKINEMAELEKRIEQLEKK